MYCLKNEQEFIKEFLKPDNTRLRVFSEAIKKVLKNSPCIVSIRDVGIGKLRGKGDLLIS